jgi:hypothetical protein
MATTTSKLESAVFKAVYGSREQRSLRLIAMLILSLKHGLRGMLFSWPLYFIALVPLLAPGEIGWSVVLFIFPAVLVSGYILLMGVREEYAQSIAGKILKANRLITVLCWN